MQEDAARVDAQAEVDAARVDAQAEVDAWARSRCAKMMREVAAEKMRKFK
jgi:hypothetical protein